MLGTTLKASPVSAVGLNLAPLRPIDIQSGFSSHCAGRVAFNREMRDSDVAQARIHVEMRAYVRVLLFPHRVAERRIALLLR